MPSEVQGNTLVPFRKESDAFDLEREDPGVAWDRSVRLPRSPQGIRHVVSYGDDPGDPLVEMMVLSSRSLPKNKQLSKESGFPFGCVVSPLAGRTPVPSTTDTPEYCEKCGAALNLYAEVDVMKGTWVCPFCSNVNHQETWPQSLLREGSPYFIHDAVDYEKYDTSFLDPMQETCLLDSTMFPTIFLIDGSLDEEDLSQLKESLLGAFKTLPGCCQVTADVYSGRESPNAADLESLFASSRIPVLPVETARGVAEQIIHSLPSYKYPKNIPARSRPRCLGAALEVAIALVNNYGRVSRASANDTDASCKSHMLEQRSVRGGRVLVLTAGPCTVGPGSLTPDEDTSDKSQLAEGKAALKYFTRVAEKARERGVVIDVLCGSTGIAPGVRYMLPLVQETGGAMLLHEGFGKLICSTIKTATCQPVFTNASFDVRLSPGIEVTQLIGPVAEFDASSDPTSFGSAFSENAVQVLGLSNATGIVVCLDPSNCKSLEYAYIQCITRWTQPGGNHVTRIFTQRLPCTDSTDQFLTSVCGQVAALIVAKKVAVSEDIFTDCEAARQSIESMMSKIGKVFLRKSDNDKGMLPRMPAELSSMAEGLYNLHRGAMLGPAFGHMDERMALASHFVSANYELSQMIVVPIVYQTNDSRFEVLPPVDMTMQASRAFLLDCGIHLFIWVGRDSSPQSQDECRKLANKLSSGRWPTPSVKEALEGSSAQRYVTARLWPLRREREDEILRYLPILSEISLNDWLTSVGTYFCTEEPSFQEWLHGIGYRPPDPMYATPYYQFQALEFRHPSPRAG